MLRNANALRSAYLQNWYEKLEGVLNVQYAVGTLKIKKIRDYKTTLNLAAQNYLHKRAGYQWICLIFILQLTESATESSSNATQVPANSIR